MSNSWNEDDLQYRIGTSLLAEFAAGHTAADVLRELIQNEYDAGGSVVDLEFGETELRIRGNGRVIDGSGWRRLSVMVGTGTVAGTETAVAAKANGIGSKNLGLRSLFLFGDRILVRSGGKQTILDRRKGTLRAPVEDPATMGDSGVLISVSYRQNDDGDLHTFTPEREAEALSDIARVVGPSVVKLASPKGARGIDRVSLRSQRLGRSLQLDQSAKLLDRRRGSHARTVRIRPDGWDAGDIPRRYSEVEYSTALTPPAQLAGRDVPPYFRLPRRRVRIGVSFAIDRRRIAHSPGIFYYPLGAVRAQTGALFSVSAPFAMNDDRSQLLDAGSSEWNRWLLQEAATFAVSLVPEVLFEQFGASAHVAVSVDASHASAEVLAEHVHDALTTIECWPSRERLRAPPRYRRAAELTVPIPELRDVAGWLRRDSVVSDEIANDVDASGLALRCAASAFDTNSLVRFRCAGPDASQLQTKDRGAQWHYSNFPEPWRDLNRQMRVAGALDLVRSRLTLANRADLAASPTTLTRSGDLSAPNAPLWVVDPVLEDVVPATTTLHPDLAGFKAVRSLCKPFELSQWTIAVAKAASDGSADDKSLTALRRLLLTLPELSRPAWKALREAPVFLDQRGEPAAPRDPIIRAAPGAALLEPVLRFAPTEVARIRELVERLRIRSDIRGSDLVALAEAVDVGDVAPEIARHALQRHAKLLTPPVVKRVHDLAFLQTTTGTRVAPSRAYERNERTAAALGAEHRWPSAEYGRVTARLKCREDPRTDDILARLRQLENSGAPLPQVDVVYRILHEAAKTERIRLMEFSDERLLWTGDQWAVPSECLFGNEHRATFGDALPVLTRQREALTALGVPTRPTTYHWARLFEHVARLAEGSLPRRLRDALLTAYERLDALPDSLASDLPVLLDEFGRLHTLDEASAGAYLINDDPPLAEAVRQASLPIAFAYPPASTTFLLRSGVSRLSERSRLESVTPGEAVADVELRSAPRLLARLADSDFSSAAAALGDAICGATEPCRSTSLADRLTSIETIDVVHSIERRDRIGINTVTTYVDHFVDTDRIVVTHVRTQDDLQRAVARAVASIIDTSDSPHRLLPDAVYFLLSCRNRSALARELEQRRIPWHAGGDDEEATASDADGLDDDDRADPDADAVGHAISRVITSGAGATPSAPASPPTSSPALPSQPPAPKALPPLGEVSASFSTTQPKASPRGGGGGGGGSGGPAPWLPRTARQLEDDQRLGERGEQIAFALEQRRVASHGQDTGEVVWVSRISPAANYDIRSVDERGREIWIEVKATVGRTGRFSWPKSEFLLAVAKRVVITSTVSTKPTRRAQASSRSRIRSVGSSLVYSRSIWTRFQLTQGRAPSSGRDESVDDVPYRIACATLRRDQASASG
jgi:hypothetical protein